MAQIMVSIRGHHFEIRWSVVQFIAINVVDNFSLPQQTAQEFAGHQPVFIDISSYIGQRVVGSAEQYIPAGRNCAPAPPIRVAFRRKSGLLNHRSIITHGVLR